MKIQLSDRALAFLKAEQAYLAKFDKRTALAVVQQLRRAVKLIGEHPHIGPAVDGVEGVRRFISAPYHGDYMESDGILIVVTIRHGRQAPRQLDTNYPPFYI